MKELAEDFCSICYTEFGDAVDAVLLDCSHLFCRYCIREYLTTYSNK